MVHSSFGLPWPGAGDEFLLRPGVAFLNHGSFGACPKPVFDAYQAWQRELEEQPVEFLARRINTLLAEARSRLGSFIGADSDNLVFVPNATYGVNIAARSFDLAPGDEVLATDHEYGATDRIWRFICGQRGANYVRRPIPLPLPGDAEIVEELWRGVTGRTKVIFMSHITSPTAVIFPVAEICKRARDAGIITVIDGAHAPGQVELALEELGADFYTGNCHKWLCAPKGAGFLYAPRDRQALLQPLVVSWGWESETPGPSRFIDYFSWAGTSDPSAYFSVSAAIEYQNEHNWAEVREACHKLAVWARRRLAAVIGMPLICVEDSFVQMFSIELPPGSIERLGMRLWDEYQVEVPMVRWNGRELMRVSIQAYNRVGDVERLEAALRAIL
ncbi:MAG TPA: aminotransferase class V-fold PLP-dependent enzyme [Chloroflexia bacterium]|nr:aminotransferase class V-fold PLP-dependent enzyme [Chloroflexia bacterium]